MDKDKNGSLHVAAAVVSVKMSLVLVPLIAEPISVLSYSLFARIASATCTDCAATKAAVEATVDSLAIVVDSSCFEFSTAMAARAAAKPTTFFCLFSFSKSNSYCN